MHGNYLSGGYFALINHTTETGGKAAAEARRGGEFHIVWKCNQVGVGIVDGNILRKAAPMGKARLELVVADLMVAAVAFRAMSASRYERDGDPVALFPAFDVLANPDNGTGKFMARYMGQLYIGIMAHPAVPVAAAQSSRTDLDHNAIIRRGGIINGLNVDRALVLGEIGCAHFGAPGVNERNVIF